MSGAYFLSWLIEVTLNKVSRSEVNVRADLHIKSLWENAEVSF